MLLGVYISTKAMAEVFSERHIMLQRFVSKLPPLTAHQSLFLLRNCRAIQKLQYLLRSSPVWKFPAGLREFDGTLGSTVPLITNVELTDTVWMQASLPVRKSGLCIRRAESLALPAFLASVYSVRLLFEQIFHESLDSCVLEARVEWEKLALSIPTCEGMFIVQREWDRAVVDTVFDHVKSTSGG